MTAYASLGELRAPEQRAEDASALVEQGFKAVKVRIARDRLAEGVSVVAAMREAVGDQLEIMVDLNQWWRMAGDIEPGLAVGDARRVIERLDEYGVLWVEEPVAGGDLSGMVALRGSSRARIAGGEMARTFDELVLALERDALDVYQPDVVLSLGISGRARSWRSACCGETAGSHRTPGPTASACSPTSTSAAASAAAR